MSRKSKGINAERELIHKFWANGWAAVRVAGSGSSKYPSPDIVASDSKRTVAIEAKVTKDYYKHFLAEEIDDLKEFAAKFNAEPWIAVKFKGYDWFFINTNDLQSTGSNYSLSIELAKEKGASFYLFLNK
jgi:Holliday junction resolvase